MKYLKKKKKSVLRWVLVALIVLLAALILVMTLLSRGQNDPADPTGVTADSQTTEGSIPAEPTEAPVVDLQIETPYAILTYPGEWSGLLQVDKIAGDPYSVVFTAKLESGISQELFSILFGGSKVDAIGVVNVAGEDVPVHLSVQEIKPGDSWTDNEISTVYAMQECLNDVLSGLKLTTPQVEPQEIQTTLPPEDDKTMVIDTPVGELYYPARWEEFLKLEVRQEGAYILEFYTEFEGFDPVHLFDIHLGGDQGIYIMDLTATDGSLVKCYVDIYEIEADINWTDAQKAIVFAMQEDINVLLAELN